MLASLQETIEDNQKKERREKREKYNKKKKDKICVKAPRSIIGLPNPDKMKLEKYKKGDSPIRFPKNFLCCISGRPHSGKSLIALHIIAL